MFYFDWKKSVEATGVDFERIFHSNNTPGLLPVEKQVPRDNLLCYGTNKIRPLLLDASLIVLGASYD
jgi:hypothetical protein